MWRDFAKPFSARPSRPRSRAWATRKGSGSPGSSRPFIFYGLDDLSDRQGGYRFNGHTGAPSTSWDPDRFVIADWAADPVTVGADGSICYSGHGAGSWTYTRIAADLPDFLQLLATWIRYFVADHGADLHAENSEVPEDIRAEIRRDVLSAVSEADKDAALSFLLAD